MLQNLEDFFIELNNRKQKQGYFLKTDLNSSLLYKYLEEAKAFGVVIDKIPNPTEKNLDYYNDIIGIDFKMSVGFITNKLGGWLPRLNPDTRQNLAYEIYNTLNEMSQQGKNLNMLKNAFIKYMCWLYYKFERVLLQIGNNKVPKILYKGIISDNELKLLTILCNVGCDVVIYEGKNNIEPESTINQVGTIAYQAETELDAMLYQDNSGIYKNHQYKKINVITLKTIYEEILILWNQEIRYRENFKIENDIVSVPVIFAKVSGVKDGAVAKYWSTIKSLCSEDTYLIDKTPFINSTDFNPIKSSCTSFLKNGKLLREKIKSHKEYKYSFMREDMQENILDKIQELLDRKVIKGTYQNGTEYLIIATILNMNTELIRLIQKFDFTRQNPNVIYLCLTEKSISLEDSILMAFLNLIGFDIAFFVPTGYQTIEKHFIKNYIPEHQVGEYLYDLKIPLKNLLDGVLNIKDEWYKKIFKRGE
ncbi:hypothetical protein AN639_06790 [Candidatus Epulonipiscium fishelsonii]|uniref:Uncharacterized protein n=1 Tax=Candidatus Epulonipiscium fishelsonii TaxID=77094 RepID=A0ACC8X8W9_9FIRM|nr:hypothetical protein AN396_10170 [Epulopiscium sp. SCG-B11WGA-EpuloA1]ONI39011.1 hypothetical protein AN639_06790 [Epulopiscium sp. SCG-B05WGA-EpuloA1]